MTCAVLAGVLAFWFLRPAEVATTPPPEPLPDMPALIAKAESGDPAARYALGRAYAKGLGVSQSYKDAAKWYQLAADQGNADGLNALGELYEAGQAVPHDEKEAAKYYQQAAEKGQVTAQYNLAVLYATGRGVELNMPESVKWYQRAAEQGDALAQYSLGMRYRHGTGVTPNQTTAFMWLELAAAQHLPDALQAKSEMARVLTADQMAEARRRASALAGAKLRPAGQ